MRARFTTDEIAAAALGIVDGSGLTALSMRSLAAVIAYVRLPAPTDDWQHDVYGIAGAMWRGIRAHPAAIPLVLTRRTVSATGFAAADALIGALERGGLPDRDRLAAFHGVLGFNVGAAQTELAGPLARRGGARDAADATARVGSVAGTAHPHVEALSRVATETSVEEDFDRGLQMLIDGIASRGDARPH